MSFTVKDLFDAERHRGDFIANYEGWELPLDDGSKLTGAVAKYVVNPKLGVAYYEVFLSEDGPDRALALIDGLLERFLIAPQFLLPQALRENTIRIRRNAQDVRIKHNQLPFLRRIHVYLSGRVDLPKKESIVGRWELRGIELVLYDQNYVDANERLVRPYAFICHDTRDKEKIARPLAQRLRKVVGPVWYDEYSLEVGDSLRESIEDGLKRSDRCVLILSRAFLENTGWAKREFDSIYTREIVEKKNVILPIWVDVCGKDLYEYSPILADRVAVLWSAGLDEVVNKLSSTLRAATED